MFVCIYVFIYLFIYLFIYSFIYSFIYLCYLQYCEILLRAFFCDTGELVKTCRVRIHLKLTCNFYSYFLSNKFWTYLVLHSTFIGLFRKHREDNCVKVIALSTFELNKIISFEEKMTLSI